MKTDTALYVVVRSALSHSQRAVQGIHAAVEFMLRYGGEDAVRRYAERDKTVVLLRATEPELEEVIEDAKRNGIRVHAFRDDDMGDFVSAVAFGPVSSDGDSIFRGLRLA